VERVLVGQEPIDAAHVNPALTLLLLAAIGLLVGLERGWRHRAARMQGGRTAGIRTFGLLGLGGGLCGACCEQRLDLALRGWSGLAGIVAAVRDPCAPGALGRGGRMTSRRPRRSSAS
jgi:hypothetical protein